MLAVAVSIQCSMLQVAALREVKRQKNMELMNTSLRSECQGYMSRMKVSVFKIHTSALISVSTEAIGFWRGLLHVDAGHRRTA